MMFRRCTKNQVRGWFALLTSALFLPPCKMSSLNSPIAATYSNYTVGASTSEISLSLLERQRPWRRETPVREGQEEVGTSTITPNYDDYYLEDESVTNESCWLGASCDELESLAPPPDVISLVPPPPLPLFLFELEILQRENEFEDWVFEMDHFHFKNYYVIEKKKNTADEDVVFRVNPKWLSQGRLQECILCEWAKNNATEPLFTKRKPFSDGNKDTPNWIETLIAVGFLSAIVGATVTCFLIKLKTIRRLKFLHKVTDCGSTEKENGEEANEAKRVRNSSKTSSFIHSNGKSYQVHKEEGKTPVAFASSSVGIENEAADSEEIYINANSVSLVYSELPCANGKFAKENPPSVTYSDVSTATAHTCTHMCNKTMVDRNQSNVYILPDSSSHADENPTNLSSQSGTSSTPSSAYYSDVSVCEIQSSRKKKKKRKLDFERSSNRAISSVSENPSTSNLQPCMNASQNCSYSHQNYTSPTPNSHQSMNHCIQTVPRLIQPHSRCIQAMPNCIQNTNNSTTSSQEHSHQIQNCIHSLTNQQQTCQCNACVHMTPNCVQYIPNFMMLKNLSFNNNVMQAHYLTNCESLPIIFSPVDKSGGSENFTKNMAAPSQTSNQKIDNSSNSPVGEGSQHYPNRIKTEIDLPKPMTFINNIPYQQQLNDIQKFDYEIYRGYSSSEVPSEYI